MIPEKESRLEERKKGPAAANVNHKLHPGMPRTLPLLLTIIYHLLFTILYHLLFTITACSIIQVFLFVLIAYGTLPTRS